MANCGSDPVAAPAGAKVGPANGMLTHDFTAETYIIVKGGGTLVTGGTLFAAKRDAADSDMTTTLNGPSCSGKVFGDFKVQNVKVGDIIVIPAGVPHGWSDIPTMVDYLSVRPGSQACAAQGRLLLSGPVRLDLYSGETAPRLRVAPFAFGPNRELAR